MRADDPESTLSLNLRTLQLAGPHGRVDVSYSECTLLRIFAQTSAQRIDTADMLGHVGKLTGEGSKRALEVRIVRLRKKLEQAGARRPVIKAIRGLGYQLCIPLAVRWE